MNKKFLLLAILIVFLLSLLILITLLTGNDYEKPPFIRTEMIFDGTYNIKTGLCELDIMSPNDTSHYLFNDGVWEYFGDCNFRVRDEFYENQTGMPKKVNICNHGCYDKETGRCIVFPDFSACPVKTIYNASSNKCTFESVYVSTCAYEIELW